MNKRQLIELINSDVIAFWEDVERRGLTENHQAAIDEVTLEHGNADGVDKFALGEQELRK